MRILVTGGSGFIGKHLLPLLKHHQLLLIGRRDLRVRQPNVAYVQGDLAEAAQWKEAVRRFSPQACIHLAWTGLPDYSLPRCLENFDSSARLIELLSDMECQKIFVAGTCWEYGGLQGQVGETDAPHTMNLFASFKTALRLVGESLTASRAVSFIWGRLFFVYGPGQRETSLIPSCYKALKKSQAPKVNNLNAVNDFIHVSDAARAIQALIESPGVSGVFNIGSGTPTKVGEVCQLVSKCLGRANIASETVALSDGRGMWADVSLIRAKTGWTPRLSLRAGIEQTLGSWEEHGVRS
ncbi:MAG: NAD(P)-dependent oxidoreductase [Desulfomonile tiedjei]|nr:NAD(P)-dependent oxidoreductase [Desulfomonile tiedjei]